MSFRTMPRPCAGSGGPQIRGYAVAQHNLGNLYQNARGVTQSYVDAVRWYRLAADQGEALGQHNPSVMYRDGNGAQQSEVGGARLSP